MDFSSSPSGRSVVLLAPTKEMIAVSRQDSQDGIFIEPRRRALVALGTLGAAALAASAHGSEVSMRVMPTAAGGASEFHWVNTVADLRTIVGSPTSDTPPAGRDIAVMQGYSKPGDGGGVFYWDLNTTDVDNDGTVIVPTVTPRTGCWKRIFDGDIDVKWFGAKGDGVADDTMAIQHALDAVVDPRASVAQDGRGNTVILPPGRYRIAAQDDAAGRKKPYALLISKNVQLQGTGGPPYSASVLLLSGTSDALLVEGIPARGTVIRNLTLYPASGAQGGHDGIVVHAVSVSIEDCFITGMKRHGLLIEDGTVGTTGVEGSTALPAGTVINSNAWRLSRVWMFNCGARPGESNYGTVAGGTGLRAHGSNTNGGVASGCFGQANNISFNDGMLGGGTWIGCYSEASAVGFECSSPGAPVFVGCFTEDTTGGKFSGGQGALVVGGSLVSRSNVLERVGGLRSDLIFSKLGNDKATYGARVPGAAYNSLIATSRASTTPVVAAGTTPPSVTLTGIPNLEYKFVIAITTSGAVGGPPGTQQPVFKWSSDGGKSYTTGVTAAASVDLTATGNVTGITANFPTGTYSIDNVYTSTAHVSLWNLEYQPTPSTPFYPFLDKSYRLVNRIKNSLYKDAYGGTFGVTDIDAPRGENLPFIANPLLNTRRRWTYKKLGVTLTAGANTLYISGTGTTAVTFLDDAKNYWPKAQTRLSVELEWDTVAHMQAAGDVHICGYTITDVTEPVLGHNAAVQIQAANSVSSSGGLTVVWHVEVFVANFDAPTAIG